MSEKYVLFGNEALFYQILKEISVNLSDLNNTLHFIDDTLNERL